MKTTATPPVLPTESGIPKPPRRRSWWRIVLLGATGLVLALGLAIVLSFRLDAETRVLRRAALEAAPGEWEPRIEFGIGRLPVLLVKAGLSFVDLEPEARAAIRAFQCADVGIYQRTAAAGVGAASDGNATVLARASQAMETRGWEPLVRVRDGGDTVAVFVPRDGDGGRRLRVCVLVIDRDHLILVSAGANPEPLIELALQHAGDLPRPLFSGIALPDRLPAPE